jgi:toxin-antitoxin system PIN domain toxin
VFLLDVNILVYAYRPEQSAIARSARGWLDNTMAAGESLAVTSEILAAVVRIVTDQRIFDRPAPPREAIGFAEALINAPMTRLVVPSSRHWPTFTTLVNDLRLKGNDVPDAFLAALAIDHNARLVTTDRGFRRFPGLRLVDPLAA